MHELAITENILEIAIRNGQQAGAARVTHIHLLIGRLSSIVDDSVQFYWDMISENTICQDAKLVFHRVPAVLRCQDCQTQYELNADLSPCPSCSSPHVTVLTGEEFRVESIEIETEDELSGQ